MPFAAVARRLPRPVTAALPVATALAALLTALPTTGCDTDAGPSPTVVIPLECGYPQGPAANVGLPQDVSAVGPFQTDADQDGIPDDLEVDLIDPKCTDTAWQPNGAHAGEATAGVDAGADHVPLPNAITYTELPPTTGPHRGSWARWGEYAYLPPQRWLHNLEHGGVALLYDPCASQALVDQLRAFAKSRAPDATGGFRYVLTPYPGLGQPFVAVTWGWRYGADCLQPAHLEQFLQAHYRKAPEDFGYDGDYDLFWLGR